MTPKDLDKCQYIGDGVYVGLYLGALWLITFDGMRTTNEICLEIQVILSLQQYLHEMGLDKL